MCGKEVSVCMYKQESSGELVTCIVVAAVPLPWSCPQTVAGMLFPSASSKRHRNSPLIP